MNLKTVCGVLLTSFFIIQSVQALPITLEGMNMIMQWTDFEKEHNELPNKIWGTSDIEGADVIGLYVEFKNGLSGSVTYSGVADKWNTYTTYTTAATATGFFTSAGPNHHLYNVDATNTYPEALPMAWKWFVMPYSKNFDLDYNECNGSHFRANSLGWGYATFATYSSTAAAVPEPTTILLIGIGLSGLVFCQKKRGH